MVDAAVGDSLCLENLDRCTYHDGGAGHTCGRVEGGFSPLFVPLFVSWFLCVLVVNTLQMLLIP